MTNIEAIKAKLLRKWPGNTGLRMMSHINPDGPEAVAVLDALVARNEQLREALKQIANCAPSVTHGWAESVRHVARAALKDAARD
jgi:hypothetical protein